MHCWPSFNVLEFGVAEALGGQSPQHRGRSVRGVVVSRLACLGAAVVTARIRVALFVSSLLLPVDIAKYAVLVRALYSSVLFT